MRAVDLRRGADHVRAAAEGVDGSTPFSRYHSIGGDIVAVSPAAAAGFPLGDLTAAECSFCIRDADAVLRAMPADAEVSVTAEMIAVTRGRSRATLDVLPLDPVAPEAPGDLPVPPVGLVESCQKVRPFVCAGKYPAWAQGVILRPVRVAAISEGGRCLAVSDCAHDLDGIVPTFAVDAVLGRDDPPVGLSLTSSRFSVAWADGSWFRSGVIPGTGIPSSLWRVLDEAAAAAAAWEVTDEWREAYRRVAALTDEYVWFRSDQLVGRRDRVEIVDGDGAPLPEGVEQTTWSPRDLDKVVPVARRWQPDLWPNPTPWVGDGIRGLVAGLRA